MPYSLTLPPHTENKSWVNRKKDKAVKIMVKTKVLLWKTIESNGTLRVRVRVKFLLFYSELAPLTRDVTWFVTLLSRKIFEEAMSDEHPHNSRLKSNEFDLILNCSKIIDRCNPIIIKK